MTVFFDDFNNLFILSYSTFLYKRKYMCLQIINYLYGICVPTVLHRVSKLKKKDTYIIDKFSSNFSYFLKNFNLFYKI